VVVEQLTLDIEQYLDIAVRTAVDRADCYCSFTDYDLQILEVSFCDLLLGCIECVRRRLLFGEEMLEDPRNIRWRSQFPPWIRCSLHQITLPLVIHLFMMLTADL